MDTLRLKAQTGEDGILKLEVATTPNQTFDVVLVMHPIEEPVDQNGWPIGFFEKTYGALEDDPIELGSDLPPDVRDEIE